jgi:serine/threonine protein kinase/tetratricopeptide (TPR) repeat protein
MGEVYLARDERLDRQVALKVLSAHTITDESSRKRFRTEALVLSKLNHPNIASIFDYDTQDDLDFLVMEYIVGTTLSEGLAAGPLPEKEIVHLALQVADALEEAHALGVVHRDLKPGNIIVKSKGQAKILDFGLAKWAQPASEPTTQVLTGANVTVGTLPYMSPEQLRGEKVDGRSDIYSLGVTLYEMSTGQRPFQETQSIALADAILHKPPPPPGRLRHNLSPRLEEIILKCLEKEPENRYQSSKELVVDLRRVTAPSTAKSIQRETPRIKPGGLAATEIDSIVALPSKVYGPEEDRFLTDAIPNTLSTRLIEVEGMETKAPPTTMDVERVGGDLARIEKAYGVNGFVLSSVTVVADRLVLNVQLVEARSRRLLWSREYEGHRSKYLELVRGAADGLRAAIRPEANPIQTWAGAPRNTEAELFYQRGLFHLSAYANRKQPDDFDRAFSDFQRALDLDPTMARAAASIATLHVARIEAGMSLGEILLEVESWAYRALQLDHRSGEAWQVLSIAEEFRPDGDNRKRLEYALKAATYASHSGYSHQVLGMSLARSSSELALEALREDCKHDPLQLNGPLFTAGILSIQGKAQEGLALIERVLSIEPDMPVAVLMKAMLLLRDHQLDEAGELARQLDKMVSECRLHPGWVDFFRDWLEFEKSVERGDASEAGLRRMVKLARGQAPPFPRWEMLTQHVLLLQTRHDSVESSLQTLSLRAAAGIVEPYDWLLLCPDLEPIRKDDRFQRLVANSRSEFEQMLSTLDQARLRGELPSYLEKPLARVRGLEAFSFDQFR